MGKGMTSRERLLAAMRNEEVDHVPCGPFGLARLDIDSDLAQELIRKTDIFLPCGVGNWILGKDAPVESQEAGNTTRHVIKTPQGELVREVRRSDVTAATVRYPLQEIEDIDRFLSLDYHGPDVTPAKYLDWEARFPDEALVLASISTAVCVAADWFGPEKFCLYWALERDRIIELTDRMNERACAHVRACCEQGVRHFRLVGGEYVSAQIGPSGMPDLIRRPDKKLIDTIHEYGGIAFYHNHGKIMPFLEDYAYIGLDFLEPMEAPPWGDTDLGKAKQIIGDRFCMVGNLDDMEVVDKLSTEQVRTIARERLEQAGPRGFVLSGTASGIYTERGARNFMAMAEVARE